MAKRNGGIVGIQTVKAAILKQDGTIDTTFGENGIYTVSTDGDGGVTKFAMSGLAPSQKEIYGNNTIVDISTGAAKPSVNFETNFMDHEILNRLLGRKKLADGSWTLDGDATQLIVLDGLSQDVSGNTVHFGFYKGHLVPGNIGAGTNTDSEARVNDTMTYKPVANADGIFGKIGYEGDQGFKTEDFLKDLFPVSANGGNTPIKP